MDIHPLISLIETKAELLDVTDSPKDLDDAISLLVGWMDLAKHRLSEDDMTVLSDVGALLYREGLMRKLRTHKPLQ
jgi:hypothetical protein